MRVTSKGKVTIPKAIRDRAGIRAGSEVEFRIDNGAIVLERVERRERPARTRGERVVEALRGSGTANRELSTDEIMRLLRGDD